MSKIKKQKYSIEAQIAEIDFLTRQEFLVKIENSFSHDAYPREIKIDAAEYLNALLELEIFIERGNYIFKNI